MTKGTKLKVGQSRGIVKCLEGTNLKGRNISRCAPLLVVPARAYVGVFSNPGWWTNALRSSSVASNQSDVAFEYDAA